MFCKFVGQTCLSEFLSEEQVITESRDCIIAPCLIDNENSVTRLIPSMTFTCPGRIVKWRAAGRLPSRMTESDENFVMRIWRESSRQPRSYDRTELTIELGMCGENQTDATTVVSRVYECELGEQEEVKVQAGDILGLEIPYRKRVFQLYFNSTVGPLNYEFLLSPSNTTVTLSDAPVIEQALPLLSLTFVPDSTSATTTNTLTESTTTVLTTADSGLSTNYTAMIATLVGLGVMPLIIILLILALMWLIKKNRRLKRKMTKKQLSDGLNSSIEVMLSESRDMSELSSCIPTEENVAYNARKKSDGYEYVINELVYASIDECDLGPQVEVGSPDSYLTILEPTTIPIES